VEQSRFRQLVWIVAAVSVLLLAAIGWSRQRLRVVGLEIGTLTSEASDLSIRNARLRQQLEAQAAVRENLRSAGEPVILRAIAANPGARAKAHLDRLNHRALVTIENLHLDDFRVCQLVASSPSGKRVITFELDPSGTAELVLEDLPTDLETITIERRPASQDHDSGEIILSGIIKP
jgi:hypothetical protein